DGLAHVLGHAGTDEASGTWTGLARPDHEFPVGSDVDTATLRRLCAHGEIADLIWEAPDDLVAEHQRAFSATMRANHAEAAGRQPGHWDEVRESWSRGQAANVAALEFMQGAGLARFAPVKPQRWVVASFGHHTGPHGIQHPHVRNIVVA